MFDRSVSQKSRHPVKATSLPFFAALVLLALTVLGMEARADDGQAVPTAASANLALLQMARSPSSVEHHEEAASVSGPSSFDLASPQDEFQDEFQPVTQGLNLNLDISLEPIGELDETVDDGEQNAARTARIASCYDASLGRYQSAEQDTDFANPLSRTSELETAMTHFTAKRASRRQFDTCSRY